MLFGPCNVSFESSALLLSAKKQDNITAVLVSIHWLPVCFQSDCKIPLFVIKCLHGLAPQYLQY